MKKVMLSFLAIAFVLAGAAQSAVFTSKTNEADELFLKANKQKTASKLLASGGALMILIGGIIATDDATDAVTNVFNPNPKPDKNNETVTTTLLIVGAAAIVASIPLNVASRKKKRLAQLQIKNETLSLLPALGKSSTIYAFGLKLSL